MLQRLPPVADRSETFSHRRQRHRADSAVVFPLFPPDVFERFRLCGMCRSNCHGGGVFPTLFPFRNVSRFGVSYVCYDRSSTDDGWKKTELEWYEAMNGIFSPLAIGAGNLTLGFGTGWLIRYLRNRRQRMDAPHPLDAGAILQVMDDVESASFDQSRNWGVLHQLLVDSPHPFAFRPHVFNSRSYARLLKTHHQHLEQLDPGFQVVPRPFMDELTSHRQGISQFADELQLRESTAPAAPTDLLVRRLQELETANQRLCSELNQARVEIVKKTEELNQTLQTTVEDFLTKLPNRRAFDRRFHELGAAFQRYQRPFCLLMIDLDHFKRINDTYGHDAGDAVLKTAARVLRECCRETDFCARFGGEEFVMLATDTPLKGAAVLAERIRSRMEGTIVKYQGEPIRFTCSIGVGEASRDGVGSQLLRAADNLLYAAKGAGRNTVCSAADLTERSSVPERRPSENTAAPAETTIVA